MSAQLVTIYCWDDANIKPQSPTGNFNPSEPLIYSGLYSGAYYHPVFFGNTNYQSPPGTYVIPTGVTILHAVWSAKTTVSTSGLTFWVSRDAGSGTAENAITYNIQTPGNLQHGGAFTSSVGWTDVDVTSLVQTWVSGSRIPKWFHIGGTNTQVGWWSGESADPSRISVYFGYSCGALTSLGGVRQAGVSWSAVVGADRYNVYVTPPGGPEGGANSTTSYSWYTLNAVSGNWGYRVVPVYDTPHGGTTPGSSLNSVSNINVTALAPNIWGNSPRRRALTVSPGEELNWSATSWDYELRRSNHSVVSTISSQIGAYTWYNLADGDYYVVKRFRWTTGGAEVSAWGTASATVTTTTETVTGLQLTPGIRKIDVRWDINTRASGYKIWIDPVAFDNGYPTAAADITNVGNSNNTASLTDIKTTSHTIYVVNTFAVPGYGDNDYHEPLGKASASATPTTLPVAAPPLSTGDSPYFKALTLNPNQDFINGCDSWDYELRKTSGDVLVYTVTEQAGNYTWYNLDPNLQYYTRKRARWTDGDFGGWSNHSTNEWVSVETVLGLQLTSGHRSITANWNQNPRASGYKIWIDPTLDPPVTGYPTGNADITNIGNSETTAIFTNKKAIGHVIYVVNTFSSGYGDHGEELGEAHGTKTPTLPPAPSPTALGDTPYRGAVRATAGAATGYFINMSTWDLQINIVGAINSNVSPGATTDFGLSPSSLAESPPLNYVRQRANWADGDQTAWSESSAGVDTTIPTITGLSATNSMNKKIQVTWDKIEDAASYNITRDGGAPTSVAQPQFGSTVTYLTGGIPGGPYSFTVTPIYTNGYTGLVRSGTTNGTALIPVPGIPTGVGDSPAKRQIACTSPGSVAPANFPNNDIPAQSFDFRSGSNNATIVNTVTATATLNEIISGPANIQIRARWADGDISEWSTQATVSPNVTCPGPTALINRQPNCPSALATVTPGESGSIADGSYFVTTSINKDGNRAEEPVGSEPNRPVNESTPGPLQDNPIVLSGGNDNSILVNRPTEWTTGDTWNVYMGTDRNKLKRVAYNLSGTNTTITAAWSEPAGNEAKNGGVDIAWTQATGAGDSPTGYKIERAPSESNVGPVGTYADITGGTNSLIYDSNKKFREDKLDSKWWHFRVSAIYSTETSAPIEIFVS